MKMTDSGGVDSFFDVEHHDSPVLKGEYATVASPVREKTLINSPIHSPSNMSKSKGSRNYYSESRSGSRSPRSPSPSGGKYGYSDSFDSEDSAQDSRPSSSSRRTKAVSRKGKETVRKRTSSSYSRDSRFTNTNIRSSGYGKTHRNYTVKRKINKGMSKGRASSIAGGNVTPRNVTEVTKRMLSAKGHTISRLRSENEEMKIKYEDSVREIRFLKQLQKKQERALDKFEGQESELPELLRKHSAELDSLHQRVRKYKEKDRSKDRQLQEQHDEMCKLQKELKKMKKLAGDRNLLERDALQQKLSKQSEQLCEKEKRVNDLERYVENIRKNQNHQLSDVRNKEQDLKGEILSWQIENERLQVQLREKEKELDIRNIYSNRVIKPPVKLKSTKSPTSPRRIMLDKSTTMDSLIQSPHPPETPKRTSSAEIRQQISEKKTTVLEKEKKTTPVGKEKKELNEHELILQQLDLGIQRKEKENKDEDDDVMKSLAMAKQRREEQRLLKEQEQKRKEEELLREKEEEMRLKREEEERLRLKKIREEANKGYVPTFASSKEPSHNAKSRPLALDSNAQSKPSFVANRQPPANKPSFVANRQPPANKPSFVANRQPPANKPSFVANRQPPANKPSFVANRQPPANNSQQPKVFSKPVHTRNPVDTEYSAEKNKPSWFSNLTTNNGNSNNMEKERLEKGAAKSIKPNSLPAKATVLADSEDEDDIPYFGSKPKTNQATYAVNSVRGMQKYSNERSGSAEKDNRSFGGNKVFGEPPKNDPTIPSTNGSHTTAINIERQAEETERMNKERKDARRKKEELLAKMREIDQKDEKPDSGRSRKSYKFTDPVQNLHNGRPSHGLGSTGSLSKDDDELAFGSYAPTFNKGSSSKKDQGKSLANGYTNEKKSDFLSNLFSKGDSEKPNTSSDNDDTLTSGTKAKPIKDKSAFPWDDEVESEKGTSEKTGRRAGGNNNSLFGQDNKAPYIGKLAVNEVDDFDDDLEEVIL